MKSTIQLTQSGLSKADIDQLLAGQLVLHCPSMRLVPGSRATVKSAFEGPGTIRLTHTEGITYTLYPRDGLCPRDLMAGHAMEAGKLIGAEEMHQLTAVDTCQRSWVADGLLPDFEHGPGGTVVSGKISELELHTECTAEQIDTVEMILYGRVAFSPNTSRKETVEIAGAQRGYRLALDTARAEACGIKLEFSHDDQVTRITGIAPRAGIPARLIDAILESLATITASEVNWVLLDHTRDGVRRIRVRMPRSRVDASRVGPPVRTKTPLADSWILFERSVTYYSGEHGSHEPTIGQIFAMIVDAGRGSIEVESIVLGTAVEMLLLHHVVPASPSACLPDFTLDTNRTRQFVDSQHDMDERFRNRLKGFLGGLGNPRAKDSLERLRERGLIDKKQIEAFGRLRNPAAHGAVPSANGLQEHLDLCAEVLVLAYHILFALVGYRGDYVNYAKRGFPTAKYGGQPTPSSVCAAQSSLAGGATHPPPSPS
jgi:hypothetical protein